MRQAQRVELSFAGGTAVAHRFAARPCENFAGRVLVVHGWGSRAAYLSALTEGLVAAGHEVVALDLPGHGASRGRTLTLPMAVRAIDAAWQRFGVLRRSALDAHAGGMIATYDVRCEGPQAMARLLSGGNLQKLVLGRVLERRPRLILANQPTRGLDVGAVAYVHERLLEARARGAAILLISEDLDELLALSDRVAVLYRGRLGPALPIAQVTLRGLGYLLRAGEP